MSDNNIDFQIDLVDILKSLWSEKIFIGVGTSIICLISVIYALSLPNLYTSSALLKLSENDESSSFSGLAAQYGGIASLAGISLPSESADKSDYVIEIVKSREFTSHLLKFDDVRPMIMAYKSYDDTKQVVIFDNKLYDSKSKKWVRSPVNGNVIPSDLEVHSEMRKLLSISKDKQSGFINISFEHKSPIFSKYILDLVIKELNILVREKDLNESTDALNYLQKQIIDIEQAEIRKAIFNLIESQLQIQMLSNVKNDYILTAIDKPYVPENKSSPDRAFILIMGAFFGLAISCISALLRKKKAQIA